MAASVCRVPAPGGRRSVRAGWLVYGAPTPRPDDATCRRHRMSFNDDAGLDTSQVESGGGGILLLILALVFGPGVLGGQDPSAAGGAGASGGTGTSQGEIAQHCRT